MKNKLFKTCLTGLALSVAGLAHAQAAGDPVKIFTEALMSHAAISGAALSIAADKVVTGDIAAQAAVSIGAGRYSETNVKNTNNIYAGAAVSTGAGSAVGDIFSGAATAIGAGAKVGDIHAGAAIAIGAGADVQRLYAVGAITARAEPNQGSLDKTADASPAVDDGRIRNAVDMASAITQIGKAQAALSTLNANGNELVVGVNEFVVPGIYSGAALSIAAGSKVVFDATGVVSETTDHVWVINLTGALTVGAGSKFSISLADDHTATIIWNVGAAVTLGAGTDFVGTVFAKGAFNAATSDVSCGNIYATAAVSVGGIVHPGAVGASGAGCGLGAGVLSSLAVDVSTSGVGSWVKETAPGGTRYAIGHAGPAGGIVFHVTDGGLHGLEVATEDQGLAQWGCYGTWFPGANGTVVGTGKQNTADIIAGCKQITAAANVASAYELGWYLPSKDELNLLYRYRSVVFADEVFFNFYIWSSSRHGSKYAYYQYFRDGRQSYGSRTMMLRVAVVRDF
jgi:hypothetical protein